MKNNDYHNILLQSLPESYKIWFDEEKKYLEKNINKNAKVLEIGSGDGRSIFDLIAITKNITGIDHNQKAIRKARQRFPEYSSIVFIKTDAENLPFKESDFDYVICMCSFMNFGNKKEQILSEMKRVLKPTGKIIISTFSQNALPERMKVYKKLNAPIKEVSQKGTVIFDESFGDNISEQFTKEELIRIFNQAKLQVVDMVECNIAYLCLLSK